MKRIIAGVFFVFSTIGAFGQITTRGYTSSQDVFPNTGQFESWQYQYGPDVLPFRLLKPLGYSAGSSQKYPLVIMLHGAGESGFDNDKQLIWGAKEHQDAVNNGTLAAFVLYPQAPYSYWVGDVDDTTAVNQLTEPRLKMVWQLVDSMAVKYNVDKDRVLIHGLSAGAAGSMISVYHRPDLFAGIATSQGNPVNDPNSNAPATVAKMRRNMGIMAPGSVWLWASTTDDNPNPYLQSDVYGYLRDSGAVDTTRTKIAYVDPTGPPYNTNKHFAWFFMYSDPRFFPYLLAQNKRQIYVMGDSVLCGSSTTDLAISKGYYFYQWYKDGLAIAGATTHKLRSVSQPGVYQVRFTRKGESQAVYSWPQRIYHLTTSPPISASQSLILPSPAGSSVALSTALGTSYNWSNASTSAQITVSATGNYYVQVTKGACTGANSSLLHVENSPWTGAVPAKPTNLVAVATSANAVQVSWNDVATTETGYEIYKASALAGPYSFQSLLPANTTQYVDNSASSTSLNYYQVRAVTANSAALADNPISVKSGYVQPMPIPTNVKVIGISEKGLVLSWTTSSTICAVKRYAIYNGNTLLGYSITDSYLWTGLTLGEHNFFVRTEDVCGNISAKSDGEYFAYNGQGLFASLYNQPYNLTNKVPDFTKRVPVTDGWVSYPSARFYVPIIDNKITGTDLCNEQNKSFAVSYRGYIYIPYTDTYTFYVRSNDGCILYVDGTVVVNNDGNHTFTAGQEKSGVSGTLATGWHAFRVGYFQNTGDYGLSVQFRSNNSGAYSAKQNIPSQFLSTYPSTPTTIASYTAPSPSLTLTAGASTDKINVKADLSFTGLSSNVSYFELFRSTVASGTYTKIAYIDRIGTNSSFAFSYLDTVVNGTDYLSPNTTYYYAVRVNGNGNLSYFFTGTRSTTTGALAVTLPNAPTNFIVVKNAAQIKTLNFTDNSNNESGFEVWRSISKTGVYTSLRPALENASSTVTYYDSSAVPNMQYYYKVRAYNQKGKSSYSDIDSAISGLTYYSKVAGDLTDLATWGTNTDGSGTPPVSFTSGSQRFIFANRPGGTTLSGGWTVSGSNSKLIVDNGEKLTVASGVSLQAALTVRKNAEVIFASTVIPNIDSVAASSKITFSASSTVPVATYGFLYLNGTGTKTFTSDSITVQSDLVIGNAITVQGQPTGLKLYGDLKTDGTAVQVTNLSIAFQKQAHTIDAAGGSLAIGNLSYRDNAKIIVANSSTIIIGTATGGGLSPGVASTFALRNGTLSVTGKGSINPLNTTGKVASKGGTLTINSSTTQQSNLYLPDTACVFKDITLNNSAGASLDVKDSLALTRTLKLSAGTLLTNNHLTLVSNAAGTARIAKVEASAILTGDVRWQRLIGPDKIQTYFFLANPIKDKKIVGLKESIPSIRGLNVAQSASISTLNEATNAWSSVKDGNIIMAPGKGYRVFIYASDMTNNAAFYQFEGAPVIGDGNGTNTGAFSIPVQKSVTGVGYNCLGNPYPCEIDWDAPGWGKSGVENSFRVWDSKNLGYLVYNGTSHIGTGTPALTSVINPGQGFLVKATSTSVLSLTEDVKTTPVANPAFYRLEEEKDILRINLINNQAVSDQMIVLFNQAAKLGLDPLDDTKPAGQVVNITSTTSTGDQVSINALPYSGSEMIIPITVQAFKEGVYSIAFAGLESFQVGVELYLHDKELNVYSDLRKQNYYAFMKGAPFNDNSRFELVLENLPVENVLSYVGNNEAVGYIQVLPNPATTSATFKFELFKSSEAFLQIFNIEGEEVYHKSVNGSGEYELKWNIEKPKVASGMYFYKISSGDKVYDGKVIVQ